MFFESYPLMMNNLLANLFFKIDVFLLLPLTNATMLGYYNAAYKFVNALNFIPSKFTLAIFPMLSRALDGFDGRDAPRADSFGQTADMDCGADHSGDSVHCAAVDFVLCGRGVFARFRHCAAMADFLYAVQFYQQRGALCLDCVE